MFSKVLRRYLFLGIFILSFIIFLAHTAYTKTAIFADGRFYYAITRSLVFDFDLNYRNEYQEFGIEPHINQKGFTVNQYPPGTSIFWIPLFWLAGGLISILNLLPKMTIESSGFGILHQSAVSLTSIFLGVLGLYLVSRLLEKHFSKKTALLSTLGLFSTTSLFFYITVEPLNSHAISFFTASLFVFYFLYYRETKYYYLVLGLLGGIAGLVRTQDALILILPTFRILEKHRVNFARLVSKIKPLTIGFAVAILPQLILWQLFFRNFWENTYLEYGFNFLNPYFIHVLFNTQNGLFTTTPAILFALLGLFLFRKKNKRIFKYALVFFLLQLYLVSSWKDYTQGGSYGIRMLVSTYPLLSFGLASVIEQSGKKLGNLITYTIIGFLSALNSLLIIRYLLLY